MLLDLLRLLSRPWAAAGFGAAVWVAFRIFLGFQFPPAHSDVWDYLQLARNIAEGEGFASNFTYPLALHYDDSPPFPTLWRVPLHSALIASLFLPTGGPSMWVPTIVTFASFALTAALTAMLGVRLCERSAAGAAVILVVLSPHLLSSSLWGLTETLYTSLLLMFAIAFLRQTPWGDRIAGICLGLSWLTRSNTLFLLPGLVLWIALVETTSWDRVKRGARILGWLALVCSPWWVRNVLVVGNPFANVASYLPYTFTETWPAWTLLRTVVPPGAELPHAPIEDLLHRGVANIWSFGVRQRFLSANPLAIGLYYFGIYWALRNRKSNPCTWTFAAFVGASETLLMVALCFINPEIRIYSTILPLVYLVALLPLQGSFDNTGRYAWKFATVMVLAISLVYLGRFAVHHPNGNWPALTPNEVAEIRSRIPSEGVILSDTPDYLAWTLDRYTLALPTLKSLEELEACELKATVLHLAPASGTLMDDEGDEAQGWREFRQGRLELPQVGPLLLETESGHRFHGLQIPGG